MLLFIIIILVTNDKTSRLKLQYPAISPLHTYSFLFSFSCEDTDGSSPFRSRSGPRILRATLGLISSILFSLSLFCPLTSTQKQTQVPPFLKKNPPNYSPLQLLTSYHTQTSRRLVSTGISTFSLLPFQPLVICPFIMLRLF